MARRSGLGKGLSALIPSESTGEADSAPPGGADLAHPARTRSSPGATSTRSRMTSLAASIREVGLLQPVLVRELEDEEDELRADRGGAALAGRPAGGAPDDPGAGPVADDVASLEQALIENLHREDLNALEEAAAYQQLIDEFGLTHEQVATRMGKGRATVTNTLRLLQLPAGAQRALAERTISAGHARALLGTPDRALQEQLVERVVEEGLTVRAVEDLVRTGGAELRVVPPKRRRCDEAANRSLRPQVPPNRPPTCAGPRLPEPGVLELEDLLSTYLNTRVKVDIQNRRGRLVVEFATLEDLERIYRAMVGDGGVA